jgi:hypothetical protein
VIAIFAEAIVHLQYDSISYRLPGQAGKDRTVRVS